jgi:signal transduction histidine kinase
MPADKILVNYLNSSPILARYNLTQQEISELAIYLRRDCLTVHVSGMIDMVEEVMAIDPSLEWKEILETAAQKIVKFLNAAAASIRIFDPETGKLVAFGSHQYKKETDRMKSIPLEQSVAGRVIRSGKSYLVPNILLEPDYKNKDIVAELGVHSLMAVPVAIPGFLKNEPDIQGTIQVYYNEENREFDSLEVMHAELLARRVSHVLAKKRILGLHKLNIQKEKIVEKIFVKLSHREGIKMKDVFKMMIPELAEIIHIQSCSLFSVSTDRRHVKVELEYPMDQEGSDRNKVFELQSHPYFQATVSGTETRGDYDFERIDSSYIFIKDPLQSRLTNKELMRFASKHNINSVLLIPLKARNEINYFLVFFAIDRRQEFTEQEIELLSFFGKEIMKALRIERLDDILHDFKNPVVAIAGFARRVKKLFDSGDMEGVRERVKEYLDIIVEETLKMQDLVVYPNIEGRERVVDLSEILKRRFRINEESIREQRRTNIRLVQGELLSGLTVFCSPYGLERVLDNLLDNATKAIPENGGEIFMRSYRDDNMACFEIRNTGRIPEENIGQIRQGEVKGRGLNIIYRFIMSMQGHLDVFTDKESTTFRIMLPVYQE